jgi:hypothetical protein
VPIAESPSTVEELRRQRGRLEGVLAALVLLVLPRRQARLRGAGDLLHDQLGLRLLGPLGGGEERLELGRHHLAYDAARGGRAQDLLGLALELRLGQAHRHDRGEALEHVVLDDVGVGGLEDAGGAHRVVEGLGQRVLEAADVGAALGRGDHVDERAHLGVVGGVPPHRHVDGELPLDLLGRHVPLVVEQRHRLGEGVGPLQPKDVGDGLAVGEELDELRDAAVVAELLLHHLRGPLVADHQLEPRHDVGGLAGAADQAVHLEPGVLGEDLAVRPEPDPGARPPLRDPRALAGEAGPGRERGSRAVAVEDARHAALEREPLLRGRAVDVDVHPRGEGVDHRQADAVQATGGDVGAAAELAARVQLGGDHLHAGQPGLGLLVGRDAAPVVVDLDGAVVVERHLDPARDAGEGLVHAVVDDLPQAVHQAPRVGGADVHAGPLAHGVEALEDQEVRCVVGVVCRCCHGRPVVLGTVLLRTAPTLPATRRGATEARCRDRRMSGSSVGTAQVSLRQRHVHG